jgi:hypothetical protein
MAERWREIVEFPGYEVSDLGRVRSVDRTVRLRNGRLRQLKGRILKSGKSGNGYLTVCLGHRNSRLVQELVLLAFAGPRPPGMLARHGDDVPTNNVLGNLFWGAPSGNNKDITRHGKRLFTYEEAEDIQRRLLAGEDALAMSKTLRCTRRHLYHIKLGAQYVRE